METKESKPKEIPTLDDLLNQINSENPHKEIDFGIVGKEII